MYWFDCAYVRFARGWARPGAGEMGVLWEHVVLNEIVGRIPYAAVNYWRNKAGNEVDFVIARPGRPPIAVECKWRAATAHDFPGLKAFRRAYPEGQNLVVGGDIESGFPALRAGLDVEIVGLDGLIERLQP